MTFAQGVRSNTLHRGAIPGPCIRVWLSTLHPWCQTPQNRASGCGPNIQYQRATCHDLCSRPRCHRSRCPSPRTVGSSEARRRWAKLESATCTDTSISPCPAASRQRPLCTALAAASVPRISSQDGGWEGGRRGHQKVCKLCPEFYK